MAKFISSLITEASGSVAGTTYSRNKNGSYIRNKSVPVNRNTLAQQAARAIFGSVSSAWKSLTPNERATFENQIMAYPYVDSLGQTKYYTASQLFKSLNNSMQQLGLGQISSLPGPVTMLNVTEIEVFISQAVSASISINAMSINGAAQTVVPAGFVLAIYATDIKSDGFTSPKNSDFRYIAQAAETVDVTALAIETPYTAVFGNSWQNSNNLNGKIWFGVKLVAVATGQRNNAYFMNQANIDA
jgi:hypothetical protein